MPQPDTTMVKLLIDINSGLGDIRRAHEQLGSTGQQYVPMRGHFRSPSTLLTVHAEKLIVAALIKWYNAGHNRSMRVRTTHYGMQVIGSEPTHYSVYVDGLNTPSAYQNAAEGNEGADYGTVVAVAEGDDPPYDAVILSCLQQHRSRTTMYRYGHDRTQIQGLGTMSPLYAARGWQPDTNPREGIVYIDGSHPSLPERFGEPLEQAGLGVAYTDSAGSNAYDIVVGSEAIASPTVGPAMACVGMFGNRGGLAIPALYHLADGVEGGVYALSTGLTIRHETISTFAQGTPDDFYVLAANPAIAGLVVSMLHT